MVLKMDLNYEAIGKRIRKIREEKGFSQDKLRIKANVSKTHISHIETGSTKLSLPTIVEIANALDTTVDPLLCDNLNFAAPILKKEIKDILSDCNVYELRVMIKTMSLIKDSFKNLPRLELENVL